MTDIGFYHLTTSSLEKSLPKLLEKMVAQGKRVLVLTSTEARAEDLSAHLWTYGYASFLPHGTRKDGNISHQPILISSEAIADNHASLLVLTEGRRLEALEAFERCCVIFEGSDPTFLNDIQDYWATLQKKGHTLVYWQQNISGEWEKKQQ